MASRTSRSMVNNHRAGCHSPCSASVPHCVSPASGTAFSPTFLLARDYFPQLKQLQLYGVFILKEAIHRLIAGCTELEGLQPDKAYGFTSLCIASPKLCTVGVRGCTRYRPGYVFRKLVIQDASCLERLLILDPAGPTTIRVLDAPKLRC